MVYHWLKVLRTSDLKKIFSQLDLTVQRFRLIQVNELLCQVTSIDSIDSLPFAGLSAKYSFNETVKLVTSVPLVKVNTSNDQNVINERFSLLRNITSSSLVTLNSTNTASSETDTVKPKSTNKKSSKRKSSTRQNSSSSSLSSSSSSNRRKKPFYQQNLNSQPQVETVPNQEQLKPEQSCVIGEVCMRNGKLGYCYKPHKPVMFLKEDPNTEDFYEMMKESCPHFFDENGKHLFINP